MWSADFLAEIAAPQVSPMFIIEFMTDYHDSIGNDASFSSHSAELPRLVGSEVSVGGGRIAIGSWTYTKGGWSVLVIDDEANGQVYDLLQQVTRGNYARLLVGFPGWEEDAYECVALGALRGVSGIAPEFQFVFDSLLTHWNTRHDQNVWKLGLFDSLNVGGARVGTAVTVKWDPAVGGAMTVTSTSGFDRGSAGVGVLLCTDSTFGDPFYMTYTGETATTFTGCSTTDLRNTKPVCLSTASGVVYACAYLVGHPCDIAQEVLLSTGDAAHGAHDIHPAEWGFAAFPEWIDSSDIDDWKDVIGNKGGIDHSWNVVVEEGQASAIGWLSSLLSEAGIWLAMRQGQVTIRAAQNTDEASVWRYEDLLRADFTLDDSDIISVRVYEFWMDDVRAEAVICRCWYNDGHAFSATHTASSQSVTDSVETLPAFTFSDHDLSSVEFRSTTQVALDVVYRCHMWETRIPEYTKVECAGLRCAVLCPGDVITVTSSQLRGRMNRTADGWSVVDALVIGVSVNWMDASVSLDLAVAVHILGA